MKLVQTMFFRYPMRMNPQKHIIAVGGGGFSHASSTLSLERYILNLTSKAAPRVAFLPQASKEDPVYISKFLEKFVELGALPSWVSLFGRVEDTWAEKLLSQDVIYVGGGNTRSMLALWREWGVDRVLKQAYEKGIILCGVSAGAICWFEQGITDSVWPLGVLDCLGILSGSACPHFDSEPERPEAVRRFIQTGQAKPGIALDDFTAAHYVDGALFQVISGVPEKTARHISPNEETLISPILV
jgi:dipeptidase E